MLDQSPFAIATAAALPEATPDFAKDLYIANAARSSEGDMVTIMSSSDRNFKKYLTTSEPVDGYSIASIEWSEDMGKTKVTISKDGNFATLTFNQVFLARQQSPAETQSVAAQVRPASPSVLRAAADEASHARPRAVIQQNPKGAPAPAPNLIDAREAIDLQQLQREQQRRQQQEEEQLAREKQSQRK